MSEINWVSAPPPEAPPPAAPRRRGRVGIAALSAVGGLAAGAAIAWGVVNADASTTSGTGSSTAAPTGAAATSEQPDHHGHGGGLGTSGTVTAVGTSSVTIKTSAGTKTYKVISTSDIDKNGEAKLSDLKVGDAVRFDTNTVNGAAVIDHLHAGNEALDRPSR